MTRLLTTVLKRDRFVQRITLHPFTLALASMIVFAQVGIYVAEIVGVPLGRGFAFSASNLGPGILLFPLSHYAPISASDPGLGFVPLDFMASVAIFLLCGAALLVAGPVVEGYYGTRKTVLLFLACCVGHALLCLVFPEPFAFGTMAFCTFLLGSTLLINFERRDVRSEPINDRCVLLLVLLLVVAGLCAGVLEHASYQGLLAAVAVGPTIAMAGFMINRKLELRAVRRRGRGSVGSLYFVEEIDLLTRDEIQERMDHLLQKISADGIESLDLDEKRFLSNASGRLKAAEPEKS